MVDPSKLGPGKNGELEVKLAKMTRLKDGMVALWNSCNDPQPSSAAKKCLSRREKAAGLDKGHLQHVRKEAKAKAKSSGKIVKKSIRADAKRTGNPQTASVKKAMMTAFANAVKAIDAKTIDIQQNLYSDLFVMVMQVRNCRKGSAGKGARYASRRLMVMLAHKFPKTCVALLKLFPDFGYWKDLNEMLVMVQGNKAPFAADMKKRICELYAEQLKADRAKLEAATTTSTSESKEDDEKPKGKRSRGKAGLELSLAAKWAPKRGKSCDRQTKACNAIAEALYGTTGHEALQKYARTIGALNKALQTTEIFMSSKKFAKIDFDRVPGRCLNRNKKIFTDTDRDDNRKHEGDADRDQMVANYTQFLKRVDEGKSSAKGTSVYIDKLLEQALSCRLDSPEAQLLEGQWKSHEDELRSACKDGKGLGAGLVLADVSGSMNGFPMHLAISLAILVSRMAEEPWNQKFINFHTNPQFIDISKYQSFVECAKYIIKTPWGGSTDIQKAFDLILDLAQKNKLRNEQLPEWLMIISDMQFDVACRGSWRSFHDRIKDKFTAVGKSTIGEPYKMPMIIYWNAAVANDGFPVDATQEGAQMVSGNSPALLKLFLTDGNFDNFQTPWDTLRKAIDSADYDPVREVVAGTQEGVFKDFVHTPAKTAAAEGTTEKPKEKEAQVGA